MTAGTASFAGSVFQVREMVIVAGFAAPCQVTPVTVPMLLGAVNVLGGAETMAIVFACFLPRRVLLFEHGIQKLRLVDHLIILQHWLHTNINYLSLI
jgi:hypothetical protein